MTMGPEPWVWLARIRRPQGRKGEVFAELLTDFPEKFAERRRLWLLSPQEAKAASRGPRLPPNVSSSTPANPPPRQVELTAHWLHKGGIVLHFAGVDSISAAEALAGLMVAIPRAERAALPEDEAYIGDLIGCTLLNVSNVDVSNVAIAAAKPVPVGEIVDVDLSAGRPLGTAPLLVVRGASGEVLIPFAKSYLRRIDVAAKRVEMALPEGLVDLNAPEGS